MRPQKIIPQSFPYTKETNIMKAVILAGGFGSKALDRNRGKPILWHIMKTYSSHGIHDFIICCGYKGYLIKEYFSNYFLHMSG